MEYVGYEEVWAGLAILDAVDALEDTIAREGLPVAPRRLHTSRGDQELLAMPALAGFAAGVKTVTIDAGNPGRGLPRLHGVYTLLAQPGLVPVAVIDGRALTELRTAAVSALATRHLADPAVVRGDRSATVVLFGAGPQARAHARAMVALLETPRTVVVSRTPGPAEDLVAWLRADLGVDAEVGGAGAVVEADVICSLTTSDRPVFDGALLPPGVHVNAVGAYRPTMQEVDATTVRICRVVVDDRDAALAESGDLVGAIASGTWSAADILADLTEVVRDGVAVRRDPTDRTLFESVGLAGEDLVVAHALAERVLAARAG